MASKESENSGSIGEINTDSQVHSETFGFTVYFKKSENNPKELSEVIVMTKENNRLEFLEDHLRNSKLNCEGDVMAKSLIEESERIFKEQKFNSDTNRSNTIIDENEELIHNTDIVCQFFLKGTCRFGDKCFNTHIGLAPNDTDDSDVKSIPDTPTSENTSLKKSKNCEIVDCKKSKKKAPMKTATDVINRIQWDEKLNPEDFTVGYLDRFLGIIENSFSSFDWEDITSVDQTILAIPRHRIQYFKYHDDIVWDKNKRLDCVFGSTGSGQTILDIIHQNDQKENSLENN